jgi:hypothetical protein
MKKQKLLNQIRHLEVLRDEYEKTITVQQVQIANLKMRISDFGFTVPISHRAGSPAHQNPAQVPAPLRLEMITLKQAGRVTTRPALSMENVQRIVAVERNAVDAADFVDFDLRGEAR